MNEEAHIKDLVARAQNGDNEAFSEVYERYFTPLYRFIYYKVGKKEEAEDLTQSLFLKALTSLSQYRAENSPFSAWLYRIASNLTIDYFRKKKEVSLPAVSEDDDRPVEIPDESGLNPEEETADKHLSELVRQSLGELEDLPRQILILHYIDGLPYRDIARIVGQNEGAVRQTSSRAVKILRFKFEEKNIYDR